jgi:hypothetical protein
LPELSLPKEKGRAGERKGEDAMEIDLGGRVAHLCGEDHALARAIERALAENGATVAWIDPDPSTPPPDLLVLSHPLDPGRADFRADLSAVSAALAEAMREKGGGRILHLISSVGVVPMRRHAAASAATAAIIAGLRALAMRVGPEVLVNAVAAGWIEGDAIGDAAMESHVPLGRPGTIGEVVAAALFLCDPMNSYTTGQVLSVDGGWSPGYGRNF